MAMLASVGAMGLGAIDYALHCDRRPSLLVVTDIDDDRLARARSIYTVEHAKEQGVELHFVNTAKPGFGTEYLRELTGGHRLRRRDMLCPGKAGGGAGRRHTRL